jgi:hypothetical protein
MLSLVLGSATHSFELMLSSFVLGLALGGLWIRKRIDNAANPGVFLGYIQIAMGAAALATVPLHNLSFDVVAGILGTTAEDRRRIHAVQPHAVRHRVADHVSGLLSARDDASAGDASSVFNAGQGERAIGVVYSANTVGAHCRARCSQ